MLTTGAKLIADTLINHGVKIIFEFPGGTFAPILDEISLSKKIDLIVTRNDQAASLMADAYARVTGKCGICMATSGPGATNLITGIANAYCDSIPIIAITGQAGTGDLKGERKIRQLGFQELDIVSATKPITKWAYQIKKAEEIKEVLEKAFEIATTGRKGPVLIDVPMDVQFAEIDIRNLKEYFPQKTEAQMSNNEREKLFTLVEWINGSKKPVIIAGGGVISADAEKELREFAERRQIPVANTLMGLGTLPSDHFLSLGFMGCYGSRSCNKAVFESDLVIGIGSRFALRSIGTATEKFSENRQIVHIDIDKFEIDSRVKTDLAIVGDAKAVLSELNKILASSDIKNNRSDWLGQINNLKKQFTFEKEYNLDIGNDKILRPQYIIAKISQITKGNAIITSDVGQNQMWTAQFSKFNRSRTNLTSAGLGNMGYGLPAALAAKYACPEAQVINISGDGSFQMNIQELATAKQYNLPVKIFIMHNDTLGLVKQFQDKKFNKRATSTVMEYNPDFAEIAKSYGALGLRLDSLENLEEVILKALEADNTVVVDCLINRDELALPELEKGHNLDDQYPYSNK